MKRSMYVVLIGALLLVTLYTAVSIVTINSEAKEVASATDAEDLNAINIVTDMRFCKTNKRSWDSLAYDPTNQPQICEVTKAMAHKVVFTEAEAIEPEPEPDPEPKMYFYANYEMTAYIATGNPCADGVYPQSGYTVASNDPNLWHRWIYISGVGARYVHDTGGMSISCLDLFVDSYEEAINIGRRNVSVYLYE